jgi:hypothetical protein
MRSVDELLQAARPGHAMPMPNDLLDMSPLQRSGTQTDTHPFDQQLREIGRRFPEKTRLVWDLDDTLLTTSYMCKEHWDDGDPLAGGGAVPALRYDRMRMSAELVLRRFWRRQRRLLYSAARYPFLKNPLILAQLRPGAHSFLEGLREAGCELLLVTASARQRWQFLAARLPRFAELWSRVMCAEDLLQQQLHWCEHGLPATEANDPIAESCRNLHLKEGLSLQLKSPLLVRSMMAGGAYYDLLVDDSEKQDSCFRQFGLSQFLYRAEALQPHGSAMHELAAALCERFGVEQAKSASTTVLDSTYPYIRLEDPLYYPLLHVSGKLSEQAKALPGLAFPT